MVPSQRSAPSVVDDYSRSGLRRLNDGLGLASVFSARARPLDQKEIHRSLIVGIASF